MVLNRDTTTKTEVLILILAGQPIRLTIIQEEVLLQVTTEHKHPLVLLIIPPVEQEEVLQAIPVNQLPDRHLIRR